VDLSLFVARNHDTLQGVWLVQRGDGRVVHLLFEDLHGNQLHGAAFGPLDDLPTMYDVALVRRVQHRP